MQDHEEHDSDLDNLTLCSSLVSAALVASLIVAQRGWVFEQRTYPRLPLNDNLSIANPSEPLLYGLMVTALIVFNFHARKKLLSFIFAATALMTIVLDQTRLQPWLYLFSVMLFLIASLPSQNAGASAEAPSIERGESSVSSILNALRICIIGTYLFAGLQKLNISFCQTVVPTMMSKIIPDMPFQLGLAIGLPVAVAEALLALLLVFARTRKVGAYLAISFHAVTLWLILQQGWNAVVWPWNFSMMLLVYLLFLRSKPSAVISLFKPDSWQKTVAILLFLLLPVLNFFGRWDNYLSSALYSGNTPVLRIAVDPKDEEALPSSIRQGIDITNKEGSTLIAERWAIEELGIPPYPEVRYLERLAEKIIQSGRFSRSRIYIETFPRFFKGEIHRQTLYLSATESQ